MRSNDALMFPETAENSGEQRARPLFWVFAERRRPRIPAANAVSLADNLPQQQQKQQQLDGSNKGGEDVDAIARTSTDDDRAE